ncbi:MAG: Ig-like domain-containing protein [Gemmatimonadota bacterium]
MRTQIGIGALLLVAGLGCNQNHMGLAADSQLAAVAPAGGSIGVMVTTKVTLQFTHAMRQGMEQYIAVHEGPVTGPLVAGAWSWSSDRRTLRLAPARPLAPLTLYTIHVGGGMQDTQNHMMGLDRNGMGMGGQWLSSAMMGSNTGMMGAGWQHANGSYGMVFTFTTE